ncbi:MAG: hypothetical protein NZ937_04895 [Armatimonadetes bacterium]|nr:hypothetical protein [Armatimonadota bacterium]
MLDYCPTEEIKTEKIGTPVGVPSELAKNLSKGRATAPLKNLTAHYQHTLK